MKPTEFSGDSVEEAVTAAARTWGVPEDSVQYEVLQKEKKGVFGIGVKEPAKILARHRGSSQPSTESLGGEIPEPVAVIQKMVMLLSAETEVVITHPEEDKYILSVQGPKSGILIGRNGQNLQALQTLVNAILHRHQSDLKVVVDVDHYYEKKEKTTLEKAKSLAEEVLKTGLSQELPPLNPFDRRLVHLELSKFPEIGTESLGEGRLKPIRIFKKETVE